MNKKLLKQMAIFAIALIAIFTLYLLDNTAGLVISVAVWCGAYTLFDYWFEEKKDDKE